MRDSIGITLLFITVFIVGNLAGASSIIVLERLDKLPGYCTITQEGYEIAANEPRRR